MAAGPPDLLTLDIGDAHLNYLDYGGPGQALIMLHATGFLPWLWHPIARHLRDTCRIYAPYFCDHREATPETGGLPWDTLAADIASFCRELHIERPCFVGHSMGGTVLTLAAALHHIDTAGLILIEPIFLPRDFYRITLSVEEHPLASRSIRRRNGWANLAEARAYLRGKPLFHDWDEEMLDIYLEHGMLSDPQGELRLTCSPTREASLFMGGMHYDPWPLLADIPAPVLIVEGEQSDTGSYIDFRDAASHFPRGTHRIVPGAGHLIPMERPTEITAIIRDFFDIS